MRIGIRKRLSAALVLIGAVALVVFVTASGALTNTAVTLVDAKNHAEVVSGSPQAVPPGAVVDVKVDATLGSGGDDFQSIRYQVDGGTFSTCSNGPNFNSSGSVTYYVNDVTLPETAGSHTIGLELYASDNCSGTKTPASTTFTTKTPAANPDLAKKCDLKVAVVLDESGSIQSAGATQNVRDAAKAFANGLVGSGSQIGVIEFNTDARVVDLDPVGSAFYNNVTQTWVDGQLASYLTNDYSPQNWTNWQDALQKVLDQANPDLVVFITDGDPTARNPAPDTNFPEGSYAVLNPALANADLVRADGSHMFVVGVGNGLSSGSSQVRLRAISGPDQYPAQSDIFKADYTLVTNFSDLQNALADLARSLCSVRVKVQKLVDNVGDGASYAAENGWTFDGTVTVSGASNNAYRWLAPGTVTGPPSGGNTRTATTATTTDGVGYAEFAWLPNPTTLTSQVVLTDNGKAGFHYAGVTCTKNGQALAVTAGQTVTISGLVKQDTVVCAYKNQKDAAKLTLAKSVVNDNGGAAAGSAWTLAAAGSGGFSGAAGSAQVTNVNVAPGTQYTLSESGGPSGYATTGVWSCTGGTFVSPNKVTLASGSNVTCTITNDDVAPKLTLVKNVSGGSDPATAWTLSATASAKPVISGAGGVSAATASANAQYTLAETAGPAGYTPGSWSCQGTGGTFTGPDKITLAVGADVTCSITNTRDKGLLTVRKVILSKAGEAATFDLAVDGLPVPGLNDVTYPGNEATVELPTGSHTVSETFGNGGAVSSEWVVEWSDNCPNGVVTVVKGTSPTVCTVTNKRKPKLTVTKNVVGSTQQFDILDGVAKLFTSSGASTSQTLTYDAEGSHTIGEALVGGAPVGNGWDVAWAGDCAGAGHTVSLAWGDAKTCTITNTKRPTLTITKNIVGTGAGASFDVFDGVGQAAVLDDASLATQSVTNGYAAGTAVQAGETMGDGVTPVDASAWTVVKSGDCTTTLAAGDEKTCTITNKRRPTVLVQKVVVGGTAKPGDFTIGITATNPDRQSVTGSAAGTVVTVDPGTFQATETNPSPLYTVSYSAGCGPVSVAFGDAQRTCTVTNTRRPSGITVTKTARQTEIAEPGGTVTFDVLVHNDSAADTVTITTLTDDPAGPVGATSLDGVGTCTLPQQIAPGADYACSFPLAISGNAGESKVDVVAAAGTDQEGSPVSDDDDATVALTDVAPSVSVVKTADPVSLPEPGGDVSFHVVVTNTSVSSDPVVITSLSDDVYGNLSGKGTCPVVPVTLQKGETIDCSFTGAVAGNAGTSHTDVVTAQGHDDENTPVSGHDDATVALTDVAPSVSVVKTADPVSLPEPGGDVSFHVVVTNTSVSSDPVVITSLSDDVYGNLSGKGTCPVVPVTLQKGETIDCSFTGAVAGNAGTSHTDVVTAQGHDDENTPVSGHDDATVALTDVAPSVSVVKTADPVSLPEPGGDVSFHVVVTNTSVSSDPVVITSLSDDVYGNLSGKGTCPVVPVTLQKGETIDCSFTGAVAGNAGTSHTDVVTAQGHDDENTPVSGHDDATVTLTDVDSTIRVTKTPSPSSRPEPGGDFTFQVTVENTSTTDTVTITSLVDRIGEQERNLDGEGTCDVTPGVVLAPGDTYSCSFTTTFTSNGPASQSDIVTASGTDDDGNPVGDSAGATVRITDVPSSIAVTKTPSAGSVQAPGGDVTFTVRVENTSTVDTVTISSLSDSVYGDLDEQGTCSVPQQLAPGQSYQCQFTGSVTGAGGTQHVNTVTAGGTDDDGEPVSGDATARVDITTPPPPPVVAAAPVIDLVVTKAATSPTPLNGKVTYTMVVTNNGPSTATSVTLADPAPTGIAYDSATPGAPACQVSAALVQCSLGSLAAGQSVTVIVVGHSTGKTGTIRNTVTVTGGGGDEPNTSNNTASADTLVVAPVKPPVTKPTPKPKPTPVVCRTLTAGPKMLKGNGKPQRIALKVYAAGKGVKGVKVRITGNGVNRVVTTGARGIAVVTVKPTKAGILRLSITNAKACNTQRIGVVGISTFEPPVTG